MNDQAYFQYQRFAGYDGKFKDNVVMQVSDDGAFLVPHGPSSVHSRLARLPKRKSYRVGPKVGPT